mmetsp:Transcript_31563/g.51070  ORF Transcript_31563/g.51070 Transcript_31563/m.51070 type:complete len:103 (-) Transcript_31563:246-554(-)
MSLCRHMASEGAYRTFEKALQYRYDAAANSAVRIMLLLTRINRSLSTKHSDISLLLTHFLCKLAQHINNLGLGLSFVVAFVWALGIIIIIIMDAMMMTMTIS